MDINIASNTESFSYSSLENSNENQILKSALKYDKDSPVYKATVAMVKQAIKK